MTLTRREFIKHSGIAAGALVVTSAAPLPAWAEEKGGKILTAGRWGAMNVEVKDGKIVSSTGALAKTIPNSLQSTAADQVHTTARIQHPMVRKSYLDNPLQPAKGRGEDTYVQVSWEQALKLIHEQHDRIRKANGPSAIFAGSYGWRSSGVLHKAQTLLQRYMNLAGGYSGHSGDYSTGAAQVIMPHVVGSVEVYEQQTSWPLILENSQVVVLWGMNPLNTLKIAWSSTDEQGLEYFHQLKKSGKPVIAIDPIRSETIEFFGDNATWIAPNMGTDVALMLGIAHTLMTQGKHDKVFLEKYTTGYPQFEEYLTGKSDNTPKSAAWAAEITGVPEAQIVKLAELMAANRTMLMAGWGMQRQQHGGILVENSRQLADFRCANTTNLCCPFGGFRYSVTLAQQIRGEDGITCGATRQKRFVVPTIFHQRMGDPQHQRNIGAHVRCHPLHFIAKEIDGFRSHWINADQLFPAVTQCRKVRKPLLIGCIPRNFQRIEWVSTPQHHDIAMFQHQRPTGLLLINFTTTHDIRHDRLCRAGRIIPQMPGITACQRHIAL